MLLNYLKWSPIIGCHNTSAFSRMGWLILTVSFSLLIISLTLAKREGPAMVFSTLSPLSFPNLTLCAKPNNLRNKIPCGCDKKLPSCSTSSSSSPSSSPFHVLRYSIIPLAASAAILLSSNPGKLLDILLLLVFSAVIYLIEFLFFIFFFSTNGRGTNHSVGLSTDGG